MCIHLYIYIYIMYTLDCFTYVCIVCNLDRTYTVAAYSYYNSATQDLKQPNCRPWWCRGKLPRSNAAWWWSSLENPWKSLDIPFYNPLVSLLRPWLKMSNNFSSPQESEDFNLSFSDERHGQGSSRHAEHCPSWKIAGELRECAALQRTTTGKNRWIMEMSSTIDTTSGTTWRLPIMEIELYWILYRIL